ncbi:vitamin B6 photo-protection and homoeostasis-domain-containing protein [Gaertneriomyces semiglobifer]|nr:vitamin B6 photo-protection and homoeostasis-domain-containing protein [Gaertneriomyces semiglobifer]
MRGWLKAMFLPVGYPTSVHASYKEVHIYQFFETFFWSTVSVLCSQAMLESIGVGSTAAAAGTAVAVQWVLKDGIGEVGKLFFIQQFARSFDSHPKTWKLIGELSSTCGAMLQLATIISPTSWFLPLASAGYALRSIHYSIWGATHMTFTRNFALQGNVGDIVAKDDSQMSVANLLGMLMGVTAISYSHDPLFLFAGFAILAPIHFCMTLALLRAARFEVLNQTNLSLICRQYVVKGTVPGMEDLRPHEAWFGEWIRKGEELATINAGAVVRTAFRTAEELRVALDVLQKENYLLRPITSATDEIQIVFRTGATSHDVIKAMLHASKLYDMLKTESIPAKAGSDIAYLALRDSHEWTKSNFPKFVVEVDDRDWQSDVVFFGDAGHRAEWGNTVEMVSDKTD